MFSSFLHLWYVDAVNAFGFIHLNTSFSMYCRDESVTQAAVAVMGDLADALGANIKLLFKDCAFYDDFLGECLQSDDEQLKETAGWTQGMIGRVMVL